jgi:hypothetical protein
LFIIVNMQARPRFSSPISQPTAPPLSPKIIVQVGEAWMPSLCSMRMAAHVVALVPSLARNFGTRNSEMPRVPAGASGRRASTRWTMLSVRSCSP